MIHYCLLKIEVLFNSRKMTHVFYMTFTILLTDDCLFQINLRLILVSGKTKEFVFSPVDSAGDIAVHVYDNWAEGINNTLSTAGISPSFIDKYDYNASDNRMLHSQNSTMFT